MTMLGKNTSYVDGCLIACIGPTTGTTARGLGLKVDVLAQNHTIEGIVDELERYFLNGIGRK